MGFNSQYPDSKGELMKRSTKFSHLGRPKPADGTPVNPPITRASTLLFGKSADLYGNPNRVYGRHGSSVHDSLCEMFTELEGGSGCTLTPSGLAANTLSTLSVVKSGDHILVSDSVYGPVKHFCQTFLKRIGVETEYFKPSAGAEISALFKPNTSCILLESPGSLTFEIMDLPAITAVAKRVGIVTIVDNTWSAGLVYNPLALWADIVTHAATKYYSGHADVLMGAVISSTHALAKKVTNTAKELGNATSPDDAYTILRGFRTVTTRFAKQAENTLAIATWLSARPEVKSVRHPALPEFDGHDIWARDFSGAGALFSFILNPCAEAEVLAFLDRLELFAQGFSFGSYESVAIHCDPQLRRHFPPAFGGPLVRIGCGLEDVEDLKLDLRNSLSAISFTQ